MKEIFNNNKILLALLLAVVLGGLVGWLIKPSNHQKSDSSDHQHEQTEDDQIWTCSMHPQIRLHEPGSCPICAMALIPASSGRSSADANPMVHEMTPEAVAMANIHTSRVTGVSPIGEVFLTGKVKADERQTVSVTAQFPGRIEQLFVNFTGQAVRPGEKLATIYSPELVTAQNELLEAASTKETFPQLYAAAREKLRLWKLNQNQIEEIEKSGKVSDQFDVLSDKRGIVTQRNISVGDYVATGSVLFEVVDLSKVWIMLDAFETDLPFVKMGDEVNFTVAGVPGKTLTARVTYIDPVINPATRAASVRVELQNANGELRPEMFVNAKVKTTLHKGQSSLAIPRTALLWSGKRSVVYVKVQDSEFPAFEMREIIIGPRMGDMYLVEAGLDAGEEIVTNGVFSIDASAQLSGNYSMMMRPKTKTMEVPLVFREQITALAKVYFEVKNALVNDDSNSAGAAAKRMESALGKVEMGLLEGPAHDKWMALSGQLSEAGLQINRTDNIDIQRVHFQTLSEAILEVTEVYGLEIDRVYKQYCPMAFDDKGANWLSESDDILNPYFGDMMLRCGEVLETYRKGQPVAATDKADNLPATGGHNH